MGNLTFYVQGSGKDSYKLTSVGSGADFQLNCSCPAGRKKVFCKHIAFLLHGEVTKMVSCEPADAMARLRALSTESRQLLEASAFIDRNLAKEQTAKREISHDGIDTIDAIYAAYGAELEHAGWDVRVKDLECPHHRGHTLDLHRSYRRGAKTQIYAKPSISISKITERFVPEQDEWDWASDDLPPLERPSEEDAKGEWKPHPKPWLVREVAAKKATSFRYGQKAIEAFWNCVRNTKSMKV